MKGLTCDLELASRGVSRKEKSHSRYNLLSVMTMGLKAWRMRAYGLPCVKHSTHNGMREQY